MSGTRWAGVGFGVWVGILAAFQQFKMPAALPLLLERYGYDRTLAGGFMSAYAAAGLVLSWQLGRALQRGDARPYLHAAFALFAIGNLAGLAWPENGWAVLAGRTVEGVGFAVLAIACSVLAGLNTGARHVAVSAALVATWIPVGQIMVNALAPAYLVEGRWQPLWWIGLGLTAASALATVWLGRSGRMAFTRGGAGGPGTGVTVMRPAERRALWQVTTAFMLWGIQTYAYLTWMPQYLVEVYGLQPAAAVSLSTLPIAMIIAFNLIGGAVLRAGVPLGGLLAAMLLVQATVWALLPVTGTGAGGVASLLCWGAACGITPTCLFAAPATLLGAARAGADAFGVLHTGRSLGVIIGPVLIAEAFRLLGGWNATAPIFAAVNLGAAVAALLFGRSLSALRRATA